MKGICVIVCGGRTFKDRAWLNGVLDRFHRGREIGLLRHGGARGADELAGEWGRKNKIKVEVCKADWNKHGRSAGPIRNSEMLQKKPKPMCVIAFPGGKGTEDMKRQARKAGVIVFEASV